MAISYRTSTSNYTTVVTTNSLTIPASTADNDLLVLYCLSSVNALTIAPTTRSDLWQPVRIGVTNVNTYIWTKRATSTDASSTVTINYNATGTGSAGLIVIQGGPAYVRWCSPIQSGSFGTSTASTNTWTGRNGDIVLYCGASRQGGGTTAPAWTTGTSAVQRTDGTLGGIAISYVALSGDTTPTPTMTQSSTGSADLTLVMIAPGRDTNILPPATTIATTNAHPTGRILKGRLTTTLDDAAGA